MKSFFLTLLVCFSVNAFADNREWCGNFNQVTYQAQTFKVVTADGFEFPQMVHTVKAGAREAIWNGEDWFSADEFHETPTKVTFDKSTGIYTVAEVKIKPKSRWKVLPGCKDIVDSLSFEANWGKREEGVNLKYHRATVYVGLSAYKGQKKPVVPTNSVPHSVVLKLRDIVSGKILSVEDGYKYEIALDDGRKVFALSASFERPEETIALRKAWDEGKAVRLYGKLVEDSEGTFRLFYDYVDIL